MWLIALAAPFVLLAACGDSKSVDSLTKSAAELEAKGDLRGALIQFRAAAQAAPQDAAIRSDLGRLMLALGDSKAAGDELQRAIELGAKKEEVLPALAKALVRSGEAKRVVQLNPADLASSGARSALEAQRAAAWGDLRESAKSATAASAAIGLDPSQPDAILAWAKVEADTGNIQKAIDRVKALAKAEPRNVEARLLLGEFLRATQMPREAEAAYREVVAIDKTQVGAFAGLVALKVEASDLAGAKLVMGELKQVAPSHPWTVLLDANMALLEGRNKEAYEAVSKLMQVFPDNLQTLMTMAEAETRLGKFSAAFSHFGKALAMTPANVRARLGLANVILRLGQPARALETLKPLLDPAREVPESLALAGEIMLRLGNASSAEAYYARAAKASPGDERLAVKSLQASMSAGGSNAAVERLQAMAGASKTPYADLALYSLFMSRKDSVRALQVLDRIQVKDPNSAAYHELRGRVYIQRGDYDLARKAFEQAVSADPRQYSALAGLVSLDLALGRSQDAISRLETELKQNPGNAVALLALAEARRRAAEPADRIRQALESAVQAEPTLVPARIKLMEFLVKRRLIKPALGAAREAVTALPDDVAVLEYAAQVQSIAGDLEQAIASLRKVASLRPESAKPYLLLADLYTVQGNAASAKASLEKALELEPDDEQVNGSFVASLMRQNNLPSALSYATQLQSRRPKLSAGYALEAAVHFKARRAQEARLALERGIQKTGSSELAARLYNLLVESKQADEAAAFGRNWMKQHPSDQAFEYQLAARNIQSEHYDAAEVQLRRVVQAYPRNALAASNLAWVLLKRKNPTATEFARRAVELKPESSPLLEVLAGCLAADRNWVEASAALSAAVDLSPDDLDLRLQLAEVAVESGNKTLAKEQLKFLADQGARFSKQDAVSKLLRRL